MGHWVFEALGGAAVRRNPQDDQHFKTSQTPEGEYAGTDALVREVIQNSLDAAADGQAVKVRIAIHEEGDAPNRERLAYYLGRLRAPLEEKKLKLCRDGTPDMPCRYLVCEDFGTRGLEGEIDRFDNPPPNHPNREDFFWFWRNIGHSGKTGVDLGRWGLGKTVYRAASHVGSMLGVTVRRSDGRRLLMGQAVLRIHKHRDEQGVRAFQPEGYWCGGQNSAGVPLPIEDEREVAEFCREWRIVRQDEPGLSVVSPFVRDDLLAEQVLQAVAVHFFVKILRRELEVEVVGGGLGTRRLDADSISDVCQRIIRWDGSVRSKRRAKPPLDFVRECLQAQPASVTKVMGTRRLPEIGEAFSAEDLGPLQRRFAAGELISVRARVWLPLAAGGGKQGHVDVYLQRVRDGGRQESYYVREGMTITRISAAAAQRGVRALVLVDSPPATEFLGDAEGPAHEDWLTSVDRPDETWEKRGWKGRVKFLRRIVDELVEVLTPRSTAPNYESLADFFSVEQAASLLPRAKPGRETPDAPGVEVAVAGGKWFQVSERAGGFTISRDPQVPRPPAPALRVAVAYDIPHGDPIKNWSPLDFTISNSKRVGCLSPQGRGATVRRVQGNIVLVDCDPEREDFTFSLSGFDRHRDVFLRIDDISGENSGEPEE